MAKLQVGQMLKIFGREWKIRETEAGRSDCNECQAHYMCAHDYKALSSTCMKHGCCSCTELIGAGCNLEAI